MKTQKPPESTGAMPNENDFYYPGPDSSTHFDRQCEALERIFSSASKLKSPWRQRFYLDIAAIGTGAAPRAEFRRLFQLWLAEKVQQGGQTNG